MEHLISASQRISEKCVDVINVGVEKMMVGSMEHWRVQRVSERQGLPLLTSWAVSLIELSLGRRGWDVRVVDKMQQAELLSNRKERMQCRATIDLRCLVGEGLG